MGRSEARARKPQWRCPGRRCPLKHCRGCIELPRDLAPKLQRGGEPRTCAIALELAAELARAHQSTLPAGAVERVKLTIDEGLASSSDEVRAAAAESLRWWGEPKHCAQLVHLLHDNAHEVRTAANGAMVALAEREPSTVAEALQGANMDGPGGADVAQVLARLNTPTSIESLKQGLHSVDPRTRRVVVQALAVARGSEVSDLIGYAVADEDVDVQIAAVRSLGQMGDTSATSALRTALASSFPSIRAEAALALGSRGDTAASSALHALLEDEEPVVMAAAIDALAALGDQRVAEVMDRAFDHDDDEVFQAALRATRLLPPTQAEDCLQRGLDHAEWNVRILAIRLLVKMNTDRGYSKLREALHHETDMMVRHALEEAIEQRESR